jgi:hypothetical protein
MALPDLHKFADDLKRRPSKGSSAPPRSIKAKDLDENYQKVTVVPPSKSPPTYTVEYKKEGTVLKILPDFPSGSELHVLGVRGGKLEWVETEDC